jgi:hypothetical protein
MPVIKSLQRLTTTQALSIMKDQYGMKVTYPTIINWCKNHGIGTKLGGQWWINAEKLAMFLERGNEENND